MKDSNNYYSFVIMPPYGKQSLRFRIHRHYVIGSGIVFMIGLLIFFIGFAAYSKAVFSLKDYETIKSTETQREAELQEFNATLDALQKQLKNLIESETEIKRNLWKQTKRRKKRKKKNTSEVLFQNEYDQIAAIGPTLNIDIISTKTTFLKDTLKETEVEFTRIRKTIKKINARFSYTPSIWPIYGRILSDYGWRVHPFSGRSQFHKGLDIPSWIGAPVKVTADGIVTYSQWSSGYGLTVVVDHGYGYTSTYAHLSKLLVRRGDSVSKGQKIANVGNSGLSTGPHLHYEIRKWRHSVDPKSYLNLDTYTAYARIW